MRLPALVFAGFGACLWAAIAIGTLFTAAVDQVWASLARSVVSAVIWWGLYHMKKPAALASLATDAAGVVLGWGTIKALTAFLGVLCSILAVKATHAYARLQRDEVAGDV